MQIWKLISSMRIFSDLLFAAPIFCMVSLAFVEAQATHRLSEPSDGTVHSLIDVEPPRIIAPFIFLDGKGHETSLAEFRGKILLINLWATWCPPCVREMPALNRLQAKFSRLEFVVIPISLDRGSIPVVQAFYRRYGLHHLGQFSDPTSAAGAAFPVDVLPASFIIGKKGRMTRFLRSFVNWDDPEAEKMIRRLISKSRSDH